MGYELVEQLGWNYPDAVFYPTGGGVGLIGMWKAFEEMEALGWVSGKRPKDVRPPIHRLRAHRQGLRRTQAQPASSSRTPPPSPPASAFPSPTATPSSSTSSANPAAQPSPPLTKRSCQHPRLGQARRHLPLSRRRHRHRRLRRPHRLRRTQTHRQSRPLQHRRRPQVHRHDRRSHAPQAPRQKSLYPPACP